MVVCKRVRYSGRVQGVGFRYTAQYVAAAYPITGYVRNLPDGDVELVAEGQPEHVQAFLAEVARQMAPNIDRSDESDEPPGGYTAFRIRH